MEHFIVVNGKIIELTKEEFENLKAVDVNEHIKGMASDEREAFKKARN